MFPLGVFLEKCMRNRILLDPGHSSNAVEIFVFIAGEHAVVLRVRLATLRTLADLGLYFELGCFASS